MRHDYESLREWNEDHNVQPEDFDNEERTDEEHSCPECDYGRGCAMVQDARVKRIYRTRRTR